MYTILKGDGSIKNIELRFGGVGSGNRYQVKVIIYDVNGNLVFEGVTYNGRIRLPLCVTQGYCIEASFFQEEVHTNIYVSSTQSCYVFWFPHSVISETETVNFLLTDQNYSGLAIERGELVLWQR